MTSRLSAAVPALLGLICGSCSHLGPNPLPPLIIAARSGEVPAVRALLEKGGDPNQRGGHHPWPALMHAIHKNQKAAMIALLDGGADPNGSAPSGYTALMMAAGYGQSGTVRELLRRGADPRRQSPGGETALSAAVGGVPDIDRFTVGDCQTDTVRALLEAAPDLKLPETFRGRMARTTAQIAGCAEVLRMLEGHGGAKRR